MKRRRGVFLLTLYIVSLDYGRGISLSTKREGVMGTLMNGTKDALVQLERRALQNGIPFDGKNGDITRVGRRGSAADGGVTGRLVLLDDAGNPMRDSTGKEIAVQWCNTGEQNPNFTRLD